MPSVRPVRKKYARDLEVYPSGLREVWLIMILPIKPSKKVSKKRAILLLSIVELLKIY